MTASAAKRALPVALVVLSAMLLAAGLATAGVRLARDDGDGARAKSTPAPAPTTGAPSSAPPSTTGATSNEPDYIREIKTQVSELRGLPWKAPLAVQVVAKDELARRIKEVVTRDARPERVAGDEATLKVLHLIPRDLDYAKAINDLLAEQVLGFYDPTTKELVVGDAGGGDVDANTKVSIAHELDHALTDQHFDFGGATQALDDADQEEQYAAYTALIEGDAVNLQLRWAGEHLSEDEQVAALLGGGGSATAVIERTPAYIRDSLLFPYTKGTEFVAGLIHGSSFKGVDDAYRRPPVSTEQIVHPDLYRAGQGWTPPALGDVAAATGCDALRRNTLGEFTIGELLSGSGDAAPGWNGDVFQTVRCGGALGMVDRVQADTEDDAVTLEQAFDTWAAKWPGSARVTRRGAQIQLVVADDAPTADRLDAAAGGLN